MFAPHHTATSAGKSLSAFDGNVEDEQFQPVLRATAVHEDLSERFKLKNKNYQRQYAHVYSQRLVQMKKNVQSAAIKKWGTDVPIFHLFELKSDTCCIVIGTLYKHMDLKPNILKEYCEEQGIPKQPVSNKLIHPTDKLILEDELQRIVLVGNIDVQAAITGVVIAVKGVELEDKKGKFQVEDYCFVDLPRQKPMPEITQDRYVVLVSGFELDGKSDDLLSIELFEDLISGQLGDEDQQKASANIVRVIIAGNSMSEATKDKKQLQKAKYLSKNEAAGTVEAVKGLDDLLTQLVCSVEVDLMAGELDPANFILPQQPLHRCMFPQATRYPTMHTVTNPYECIIDGVQILATSGQNVSDIYKYTSYDDHIEILENTLRWGHIAPTAPDTLGCYPYYDVDPFILTECPHIYVVGNQPDYFTKMVEGDNGQKVLLMTLPRFSITRSCVLVNLRNLECQPITFRSSLIDENLEDSPLK